MEPRVARAPGTNARQPEAHAQRRRPAGQLCSEMGTLIDANPGHINVYPDRHRQRGIRKERGHDGHDHLTSAYDQPNSKDQDKRWRTSNEVSSSPPTRSFRAWPRPGRPTPQAAAAARGPNSTLHAGDPGGSADLTRQPSPVAPVNHRFNVDDARMPQPPAAVDPGKGAIPVNPFLASAGIAADLIATTPSSLSDPHVRAA